MSKIIVSGAGIGGLACVIALRRAGIEAVAYEKAKVLRGVGSGLTIYGNGVKALAELGLLEQAKQIGQVIDVLEVRQENGEIFGQLEVGEIGKKHGTLSLNIKRGELLTLLANGVADEDLKLDRAFLKYEQDNSGVDAKFSDGHWERCAALIGAGGFHSAVREQLIQQADPPRYSGYTCWRGITTFSSPLVRPGTNMLTVGEGGTFGIIPLSDGTVYWYGTSVYPEGAKDTAEGRKADVRNQFSRWHAPIPALIEASDETVILREDIYDRKPISHWGTGLITMLGDAAHPCVPVLGMGACLALEDAVVLAKSIKETGYMEGALRIYEARRIPRTAEIVKRSHQVAQIMHANNMLALMYRTEFLTKYMQGEMSKQFETIMKVEL